MAGAVIVLQAESQQRHHTATGPGDEQQVSFQPQPTPFELISSEPEGSALTTALALQPFVRHLSRRQRAHTASSTVWE